MLKFFTRLAIIIILPCLSWLVLALPLINFLPTAPTSSDSSVANETT